MASPNVNFSEITALRQIVMWGEITVVPIGVQSPWEILIRVSEVLLLVFIVDAAVSAWRQGARQRALIMGIALFSTILAAAIFSVMMVLGNLPMPMIISLPLMIFILTMGYQLSNELVRARQTSQELEKTQKRMKLAAKTADLSIWEWDIVKDEIWTTEAGRKRLGAGQFEPINLDCFLQVVHPDDRLATRQAVQRSVEDASNLDLEYRVVSSDGSTHWIATRGQVERDGNGKPCLIRGVSIDITERRQAEESLRATEQLAHALLHAANDIAHVIDEDGTIIDLNDAMAESLGGTREELIGTCVFDRFSKEAAERKREIVKRVLREQKPLRIDDLEGRTGKLYESNVYPIATAKGEKRKLAVFARDITERRQAEQALRESQEESQERLKEAQRVAHIGSWELNLLKNTLSWSDEVFRIFEIDREHFGASYEAFLNTVHPEDRDAVNAAYTNSLETRSPYEITHRLLMPDGRVKYVHERCETFYSPEGKPLRSIGTVQDITALKHAETERIQLRNELAHLSRAMLLSELSASLAHEINQPLGAILNNASAAKILSSKLEEENTEFGEILSDIIRDANRAGEIVRKIRGVVKKGETNLESLHLNILIEEVVNLYKTSLNMKNILAHLDLQPDLFPIKGDRIRLQQVLMNLIANAMEAMRESSLKTLTIRSTMQSPDMVTVSVSDSGTGIDDAKKDKVFEPFFTTKKDGLGMGLRICKSIIEEHGGRIWVENNPVAGATFSFSLKTLRGDTG